MRIFLTGITLFILIVSICFAEEVTERSDWKHFFDEANVTGTIVIADERQNARKIWTLDAERAMRRFMPASTFKIPHALMALETGVVRDEFQVFKWDKTKRMFEAWNQDQDLRSSMRHSAVWVYQNFAKEIPEGKATEYLRKIHYGNTDASGGNDGYWLDGNLKISAREQINFLRKLYRNELPFQQAHQRLVKDIIILEAGRDWILRGKTGWSGSLGWWVGWVERPDGAVFVALNIDTPHGMDDLPKREAIARSILKSIEALP